MTPEPPDARLRVDDFDYELPATAIAQTPTEPRDAARLLVLDRDASAPGQPALSHRTFREVGELLRAGDLLVVNDSRVIPARLPATRAGGGPAEILLLRPIQDEADRWEALVRPSRRVRPGATLVLRSGDRVEVGESLGDGTRAVRFDRDPYAVMDEAGDTPLPPYIQDHSTSPDRYQTVYARPPGSAAAPTAGLHFTAELLRSLEAAAWHGHRYPARRTRHVPAAGRRVRGRASHPSRVVRDSARDRGGNRDGEEGGRSRGRRGHDQRPGSRDGSARR